MKHCFRFLGTYQRHEDGFLWTVTGDELRHLSSVLRIGEGDLIEVFDGKGFYSMAVISELHPKKQALAVAEQLCFEQKSEDIKALAIGALKPKSLDDLIPCLVELGLHEIHVFAQKHTEKFKLSDKNLERWNKVILSSSKQCKRNYLPKLKLWNKRAELKDYLKENFEQLLLLSPEGASFKEAKISSKVCGIIGSEAGLSEEELKPLKNLDHKNSALERIFLEPTQPH